MLGNVCYFNPSEVRAGKQQAPGDDRNRVLLISKGKRDALLAKVMSEGCANKTLLRAAFSQEVRSTDPQHMCAGSVCKGFDRQFETHITQQGTCPLIPTQVCVPP